MRLGILTKVDFLLRLQESTHPLVAYLNRFCSSTGKNQNDVNTIAPLTERALYDVWHHRILKLRFRSSTWKRQSDVFKNLHSGDGFQKPAFLVPENAVYVWTVSCETERKSPFSKISGYLWIGPESVFVSFSDVPFVKWMTFSLNMSHVFLVTREWREWTTISKFNVQ